MNKTVIPSIDSNARREANEHQDQLTKPTGALGDLESIACWLAGIQRTNGIQSRPAALLIFASDHPVSLHGVSAYPREVTGAMLHNILNGGAASSVLCAKMDIPLHLWDVGVEGDYPIPKLRDGISHRRLTLRGTTGNLFETDAMDEEALRQSLQAGIDAIDSLDSETRIVIFGEMGIGNTTPSAAISAALLQLPASEMVGAGTGVEGTAFLHKTSVVQTALDRCAELIDPEEILRRLGGREIAALVGGIQRAAEKGMAVWVDGFIVSSAALMACRVNPDIRPYLYFAHQSAEQGHKRILAALNATPLINCNLRLGEGSGALTAFPLLELAVALHCNMATFAQAAVPDRGE